MPPVASHRPTFVPRGGATWESPWEMYADLREQDPVHHVVPEGRPTHDYYVLTRHADVLAAATDPATYSSRFGLTTEYGELDRLGMSDYPPMVMQDPPVHTAFRKLVSRGFTPRQVRELEPAVRAYVGDRLDRFVAAGGGDIVKELFKPLPSMVVAYYLGVPTAERDRFDGWTDAIVAASSAGRPDGAAEATAEILGYFGELIERRRSEIRAGRAGEDTVSHLVAAGVGDDDAGLLSILAYVFTMITGGNDTTTGALGGAVQLLARHPEQRAELIGDPALVKEAVEELLRLTSPVQGLARTVTRDVELHGVPIPAGRKVLLCYAAANRDPRRFGTDAEELDIHRRPTQILTFGQGHHHCIGNNAARMQVRVALEELLARIPEFDVDFSGVSWAPGSYVRRPLTVPLVPA